MSNLYKDVMEDNAQDIQRPFCYGNLDWQRQLIKFVSMLTAINDREGLTIWKI